VKLFKLSTSSQQISSGDQLAASILSNAATTAQPQQSNLVSKSEPTVYNDRMQRADVWPIPALLPASCAR
jgi:hypothetical protein